MTRAVGVLGHGRFGAALCDLSEDAGLPCLAFDPAVDVPADRRAASPQDVAGACQVVLLAVPVERMAAVLADLRPHLTPEHLVLDVGSVKTEPMAVLRHALGEEIPWAGSHPLFGPASLARGERPLRVVLCPAPEHPDAGQRAGALFESLGCTVEIMTAEAHDRSMAVTHALTFFLAKGLLEIDADFSTPVLPPSTRGIGRAIRTVQADAGHLLETLHRSNPFASEARASLLDALGELDRLLALPEPAASSAAVAAVQIPGLGVGSPELVEVRDLIDELDLELVALLARRGRLAKRALRAKSRIGKAVRDPGREDALLADRRTWAASRDLDPERVEEIFRAVLQFSVALQEDT